ncbi:hypothetical protein BC830DRAFT_392905 [Chytriomyces sp. MP71]|nr:hypothetical protein BC830DRAFT_392905 [Chytriomyces sp. MP71]
MGEQNALFPLASVLPETELARMDAHVDALIAALSGTPTFLPVSFVACVCETVLVPLGAPQCPIIPAIPILAPNAPTIALLNRQHILYDMPNVNKQQNASPRVQPPKSAAMVKTKQSPLLDRIVTNSSASAVFWPSGMFPSGSKIDKKPSLWITTFVLKRDMLDALFCLSAPITAPIADMRPGVLIWWHFSSGSREPEWLTPSRNYKIGNGAVVNAGAVYQGLERIGVTLLLVWSEFCSKCPLLRFGLDA